MLSGYLTDEHEVVRSAAILQQNCENLPDGRDHAILLLRVLQQISDQFIESDGVNEQAAVDAIDVMDGNASALQLHFLDAVARDGLRVLRLENDTWDVQMLRVL